MLPNAACLFGLLALHIRAVAGLIIDLIYEPASDCSALCSRSEQSELELDDLVLLISLSTEVPIC